MVGRRLHLGPPGARRRVRHAQPAVRAPPAPVLRLLRPPPDRPADVAGDDRPPDRPLLPRLRPDLLLPARDHARGRDRGHVRVRLAARADRARDHADPRRSGVPLQPHLAPDPARRPAEDGGRRHRRRGEHRRRPRGQVVRAGAVGAGEVRGAVAVGLPPERPGEPAARVLRAADLVHPAARAGSGAPGRRLPGHPRADGDRRLHRLQPAPRDARHAAADARHVDRAGAARDRLRRAHLPGDGRAGGGQGRARTRSTSRPATASSASRTSPSPTSRDGRCSSRSSCRSTRAGRSR